MQPWNGDTFIVSNVVNTINNSYNCGCISEYIYESNEIKIARLTAEAFLALVGILFNVFICVISLKHSTINAAFKLYIRNMALADIGVLLFGFPFAVAKEQQGTGEWILGDIACKYGYPITEVFYGVSTWTLVAIAVQRYRILKPRSWRRRKPSSAIRVVVVIWIMSLVIISLPVLLASHYGLACGKTFCFIKWPSSSPTNKIPAKIHSFALFFILFVFPVGVVVWSYCKVSITTQRGDKSSKQGGLRHRRLQSDNSENTNPFSEPDETRLEECGEVKRLVTPLVIVFVISTIPMNILRILFIFKTTSTSLEHYLVLFNLSIMLTVCNSVVRPFIYYLVNHDIRNGCRELVTRLKQGFRRGWGEHHDEMVPLQEIRISRTDYKETIL